MDKEVKEKYVFYFLIAVLFFSIGFTLSTEQDIGKVRQMTAYIEGSESLARQLTEARWVLLYESDKESSEKQLELFGDATRFLSMIDCEKVSCWSYTHGVYPTWIKAGPYRGDVLETQKGFKDIEELELMLEGKGASV